MIKEVVQSKRKMRAGKCNLGKSIAWDKAFFTQGRLNIFRLYLMLCSLLYLIYSISFFSIIKWVFILLCLLCSIFIVLCTVLNQLSFVGKYSSAKNMMMVPSHDFLYKMLNTMYELWILLQVLCIIIFHNTLTITWTWLFRYISVFFIIVFHTTKQLVSHA